jgi:hypothetical protein
MTNAVLNKKCIFCLLKQANYASRLQRSAIRDRQLRNPRCIMERQRRQYFQLSITTLMLNKEYGCLLKRRQLPHSIPANPRPNIDVHEIGQINIFRRTRRNGSVFACPASIRLRVLNARVKFNVLDCMVMLDSNCLVSV